MLACLIPPQGTNPGPSLLFLLRFRGPKSQSLALPPRSAEARWWKATQSASAPPPSVIACSSSFSLDASFYSCTLLLTLFAVAAFGDRSRRIRVQVSEGGGEVVSCRPFLPLAGDEEAMKGSLCVLLFAAFSLVLNCAGRHVCAVEVNASATVTETADAIKKTSSQLGTGGEEKKSDDLGKGSQEEAKKNHVEESLNEPKVKPSEEVESNHSTVNHIQNSADAANTSMLHMEDTDVDGCDPSNRCINEEVKFIACLRVPGQDSLDLSLLIQNRGTRVLDISVLVPDFVQLEETSVKLEPKLNKEVKVFIKDGANDSTITLNTVYGNCSLSLRNMISSSVRGETSRMTGYLSLPLHNISISIFLVAVVFTGAAWLGIRIWRKGVSRYQKIDMSLPVSTGGNKETKEEVDGWDNSWDDGWDDEAPKTPSKPVSTPSFKGLASRKLNKDGWKD